MLKPGFLLLISFLACFCWPQSETEATQSKPECCGTSNASTKSDNVVCLSEQQMRSHLVHMVPLKPKETRIRLHGTLVLKVRFESDGSVIWVKALSGHPHAIASAMEVVPKWKFSPVTRAGEEYGGCGLVRVKYRLSDSEQETTVQ